MNTNFAVIVDWGDEKAIPSHQFAKRMGFPGFGLSHVRDVGRFSTYARHHVGPHGLTRSRLRRIAKRAHNLALNMQQLSGWAQGIVPTTYILHGKSAEDAIMQEGRFAPTPISQKTEDSSENQGD